MNGKKKAVILVMIILLDFCHGHPTPPLSLPGSQQRVLDDNDDDSLTGNEDQRLTINKDDLAVLNEFLHENGIDLTSSNRTLCGEVEEHEFYKSLKNTPVAGELYSLVSSVILALEGCLEESSFRLNELKVMLHSKPASADVVKAMVEALVGEEIEAREGEEIEAREGEEIEAREGEEIEAREGEEELTSEQVESKDNVTETRIILRQPKAAPKREGNQTMPERRYAGNDTVTVPMQTPEMQENQTESSVNKTNNGGDIVLSETFTDATQIFVKSIISELRLMESLIQEEKQLGNVECEWSVVSRTCFLPLANEENFHWIRDNSEDQYGGNLAAKFACEQWGSECVGLSISTRQNDTLYQLLRGCNRPGTGQSNNFNVQSWFHLSNDVLPVEDNDTTPPLRSNLSDENITTEIWLKDCSVNQNSEIKAFLQRPLQATGHVVRRDAEPDASVTVYEHIDFAGANTVLTRVIDTIDEAWDNKISSLRFPEADWSVVVFQEPNFLGRQAAFTGNTNFVGDKMNEKISSMIVLPYRLDQLCFSVYEDANFQGRHQRFCGDQDFTSTNWNKRISSLRVESEVCGLILYDRSYEGKFKMFSGNVGYVGNEWNNRMSSIQIRPWILDNHEGQIQPITLFYEHPSYRGESIAVEGATEFIGHSMNDKVSSVKCDGECAIVVFEHSEYKGQSRLYDGSQMTLSNFNNRLSSALVLMNRICVTFYEHSNYRGDSRQDCTDVDVFSGYWNNRVSSLKVHCTYCSVIVYQHSSYQGDYKAFAGHVPYVGGHWNDMISSLQIRPWKLQNYEKRTLQNYEKKSCESRRERRVYNVIQWIPIVSNLYGLATSAYYGAKGCLDVARERVVDFAVGAVTTILTGGMGAVGGALINTGVHAAKKVVTSTIKNAARRGLSSDSETASPSHLGSITGNVKLTGQSIIRNAKEIVNAAKALPKAVKSGAKNMSTPSTFTSGDGDDPIETSTSNTFTSGDGDDPIETSTSNTFTSGDRGVYHG